MNHTWDGSVGIGRKAPADQASRLHPSRDDALRRLTSLILAGLSALLIVGMVLTPTGLFTTDEAIYLSSAESFARDGSFAVRHGYEEFPFEALAPFLDETPDGFVPHYPGGNTVVGGLFILLFGLHGLIVMNALAAIGTLWTTRALARAMFGREDVALAAVLMLAVGTFWGEYALGIWTHSISILFITLSLLMGFRALDAGSRTFLFALLSGLSLSAGLQFRVDTALLLPALGCAAILFAGRPVLMLLGGVAGLLPGLAASAAINASKFGSWNPLSYGTERTGGTSHETHLAALAVIALLLTALCALRHPGVAKHVTRPRVMIGGALALGLVLLSPIQDLALRYANGIWTLIFDATAIVDYRTGVVDRGDGTVAFWGLDKKALGQSLPWLGVLALPLVAGVPAGQDRRGFALGGLAVAVWTLPFLMLSWHGGLSSNMRYFAPLLPVMSVLAAYVIVDLFRTFGDGALRVLIRGALGGIGVLALWIVLHPSGFAGAQQILSTYLFALVLAVSLATGFAPATIHRKLTTGCIAVSGAGIAAAVIFSTGDFIMAQIVREMWPAVASAPITG